MILISGDSWAAGAWGNNMDIIHGGLAQYLFDDGYHVINLGHPGGWNGLTVSKLETFLELNLFNLDKISHIFVFQTEWIRDIVNRNTLSIVNDHDFKNNYQTLKDTLISRFYYSLDNIGKIYGKKIYIIGGASDTIWLTRWSTEYPNLEIVCQSFTNLLINQCHRVEIPALALFTNNHTNLINNFKNSCNETDLKQLLNDLELGSSRFEQFYNNKESFWPDGVHPNQKSHKILFDYLKEISII